MIYLEGKNAPVYKHESFVGAETEAKRLVEAHGCKAYILATIKSIEINKFIEKDCTPNEIDNLPF